MIQVVNVITWVVSDVMLGSCKLVMSRKRGRQSVFTTSLHRRQYVITIGHQGHTKVVKGSHMSQKIA